MRTIVTVISFLFLSGPLSGQDFGWWNNKHDWDGVTPWQNYLIMAPAYLGPNALPVPEHGPARIGSSPSLEMAAEYHHSPGDRTSDIRGRLSFPVCSYAELSIHGVFSEWYRMDTLTRDIRRARDRDGEGQSLGDVLISTRIRLSKARKGIPDAVLGIHLKTASGNNLSAARFTDSPGYWFDLSLSKDYMAGGKTNLTPFMQVGLFVWQTRIANNPQNDAFLYSAGLDLRRGKLRAKTSAGGYYGYFGEGDRPLVYRLGLWYEPSARHSLGCQWQEGLRDFEYTSIRISYSYQLSKETEQRHSSGNDQP